VTKYLKLYESILGGRQLASLGDAVPCTATPGAAA